MVSTVEKVTAAITVIERDNPSVNAFCEVFAEEAMQDALQSDLRRKRGNPLSALDGMTFAVKDNFAVENHICGCASRYLQNYVSPYSATAINLLRSAGMILLGRLNMDEFGMGSFSTYSCYGAVHNPLDTKRSAGGSSGGCAAAVASQMVDYTLGSDTGGSIRQPASYCGIVGYKPAYGSVSRYGLTAFASSLDCVGIMGRTVTEVECAAKILTVMDENDSTCKPVSKSANYPQTFRGKKIAYWNNQMLKGTDPGIISIYHNVLKQLERNGAILIPYAMEQPEVMVASYYLISACEASSNLARFDGVRFGCRNQKAELLEEMYLDTRSEAFGTEVKRRMVMGAFCLSSGYINDYYLKAISVRNKIKEEMNILLSQCDYLFTPASPTVAPLLEEAEQRTPMETYLQDIFTVPQSLAGLPSICVPCGKSKGMPVGLCITVSNANIEMLWLEAKQLEALRFPE